MAKKPSRPTPFKKLAIISGTIVAILLLITIGTAAIAAYQQSQYDADVHGTNAIRQTLVQKIDELSEPAPRDATSGDYYFPEAKLTLPSNAKLSHVAYSYNHDDGTLRVASQQMYGAASSKLYGTSNPTTLFEILPQYQACKRGMAFNISPLSGESADGLEEVWQNQLPDGRTLYAYTEVNCSIQSDQIDSMRAMTSY